VKQDLKGNFYPLAVGSLPYRDPARACEKIVSNFKDIPFWPQLVKRSFFENMYVQFSERLPGAVVDEKDKNIYVNTAKDFSKETEIVYEKFLNDDVDFFSISRSYAEGLYKIIEVIKDNNLRPKFIKGQITGPISFGLTVTDDKKRPLFYDPDIKEALVKIIAMRARWQVRKLKEASPRCIIFIDEPYLVSIGSSFVSLNREEAFSSLNEVVQAIHQEGALCGIHCCGNTDWGFVLATDIDILNFDAYNFYESVSLYPGELSAFLDKGGSLAWGIIPNNQDLLKEDNNSLGEKLEKAIGLLVKKGIKKQDLLEAMIITPSCGLGLVDEQLSDAVIERTVNFSGALKERYK